MGHALLIPRTRENSNGQVLPSVYLVCWGYPQQSLSLSLRKKDSRDALSGLEIVLVTPIGLVLADFAQSAKKYQYLVSGCNPVASTLTVKSTS